MGVEQDSGRPDVTRLAAALVLPRLAAFGAPLDLRAMPQAGPVAAGQVWFRLAHLVAATTIGVVVLAVPVSALTFAVGQFAGVSPVTANQHVPGGVVRPVLDDSRLAPAHHR